jgi:hypothetical protein
MIPVASYSISGFGEVDVAQQNDAGNRIWDLFAASGEWLNEGHPFRCKPRRAQVEAFLTERLKAALARIEKECKKLRTTQEELDELVHEAAQADNTRLNQTSDAKRQERLITSAEQHAARVNNGGRASQLVYLLEVYGEAGVPGALRDRRKANA